MGFADVFIRDLQAGSTALASVGAQHQFDSTHQQHRHQFAIAGNDAGRALCCFLQHRHQSGGRGGDGG